MRPWANPGFTMCSISDGSLKRPYCLNRKVLGGKCIKLS